MKFPFLALFERSQRLETRSLQMCFVRMALPAVILLALTSVTGAAMSGRFGAPGLRVFQSIAWLNFVFITLAGMSYFASAITEEKEEMMLGLLRMTGLSSVAILLGKSSSRLAGAAVLLLVQFPFTLLAVTLGGIGLLQIISAYAILLAYIFFLCNLALTWSVVFQRTVMASVMTAGCLGGFLIVPPVLAGILGSGEFSVDLTQGWGWAVNQLCINLKAASPVGGLQEVFVTGGTPNPFSFPVVSNLVFGGLFFLLAWALFEPCTRAQKDPEPGREFHFRFWSRRVGRSRRVPPHIVAGRALAWREYRTVFGGVLGHLVIAVLYALVACAPAFVKEPITRKYVGDSVMILSLVFAAAAMASVSARIFSEEVRWKTLSALIVLPVTVRELAYRKILGSLCGLWPFLGYFVVGAALCPADFSTVLKALLTSSTGTVVGLLSGLVQFVFFLHLVAYLSLVVKRGALPLAFAICYFGFSFVTLPLVAVCSMLLPSFAMENLLPLLALVSVCLTVFLHLRIGRRLGRAAAEA